MIDLIIVLIVTALGWLIYELKNAPVGYQDEETQTFYYGKEEK